MKKRFSIVLLLVISTSAFAARTYSGPFASNGSNLPPGAVTANYYSSVTINATANATFLTSSRARISANTGAPLFEVSQADTNGSKVFLQPHNGANGAIVYSNWETGNGVLQFAAGGGTPQITLNQSGSLGIGITSPATILDISGAATLQNTTTPANPNSSSEGRIYIKGGKFVIQYNDAGTVRYKYLDLTSTGVTWTHSTSAP